jgi:hypothetical protein
MATSTAIPTKLKRSQVLNAGPQVKFDTDTFVCALVIPGSGAPDTSKTGIQFLQDVFTGGNTEVTGTGYARQTLTGVSAAFDSVGTTLVDFAFNNITFSQNAAGFTNARYAIIVDTTIGANDAAHPVIAVCDLGSNQSSQPGDLVLAAPAGGLIQWQ